MSLRLVTAEMRLSTAIARTTLCVLGPSGSGKTSLMKALPGKDTLCLDFEAGLMSVQDWDGDSIPIRSFEDARDMACLIGGDAFQVVEVPEVPPAPRPERCFQRRAVNLHVSDTKQAERVLFFVLDDDEAAVGELLNTGGLVDAGQGLKTGYDLCAHVEKSPRRSPARRPAPEAGPLALPAILADLAVPASGVARAVHFEQGRTQGLAQHSGQRRRDPPPSIAWQRRPCGSAPHCRQFATFSAEFLGLVQGSRDCPAALAKGPGRRVRMC